MWKSISYAWQVAVNLLYLAVVVYVFSQLDTRDLTIIVATLGLIFVTVRTIAIGQFAAFATALVSIARDVGTLKAYVEATAPREDYDEVQEQLKMQMIKLYIDGGFLSLITIICLFQIGRSL